MKNKFFFLCVQLILSTTAMAGVDYSFSEYDGVLGAIKLNNACKTLTEIKTINPVEVCTKLAPQVKAAQGDEPEIVNWHCVSKIKTDLSVQRAFQRSFCKEFKYENDSFYCAETELKDDFIPDTIKTSLVKDAVSSKSNYPGTVKYVSIEDCKKSEERK